MEDERGLVKTFGVGAREPKVDFNILGLEQRQRKLACLKRKEKAAECKALQKKRMLKEACCKRHYEWITMHFYFSMSWNLENHTDLVNQEQTQESLMAIRVLHLGEKADHVLSNLIEQGEV